MMKNSRSYLYPSLQLGQLKSPSSGQLGERHITLTRRTAIGAAIVGMPILLSGCGGGGGGEDAPRSSSGPTGAGNFTPIQATNLPAAAAALQQRYSPALSASLVNEIASFTLSEAQARPTTVNSLIAGSWRGEINRRGLVRMVEFQTFANAPFAQVFGNPADVSLGVTEFTTNQSILNGSGSAYILNARDGLRLSNDSLQLFFGFSFNGNSNSPGLYDLLFLTTGQVRDPAGTLVGVGLNIWSGRLGDQVLREVSSGQFIAPTLNLRYRFVVLEDYAGGRTGLRNDFDTLLIATNPLPPAPTLPVSPLPVVPFPPAPI